MKKTKTYRVLILVSFFVLFVSVSQGQIIKGRAELKMLKLYYYPLEPFLKLDYTAKQIEQKATHVVKIKNITDDAGGEFIGLLNSLEKDTIQSFSLDQRAYRSKIVLKYSLKNGGGKRLIIYITKSKLMIVENVVYKFDERIFNIFCLGSCIGHSG